MKSTAWGQADGARNPPSLPPRAAALGEPPVGMDRTQASACDAGDAHACVLAARSYAPKGGYRADLSKAEADAREQGTTRYALRACDLKDAEGCALAAKFGPYDNLDSMLTRACTLGHAASCGMLGIRMFTKVTRPADRVRVAELVEKACVSNVTGWLASTTQPGGFCRQLSIFYREYIKDRAKARHFRDLGCSQGYKHDCPCKVEADCGAFPKDEAGDGYSCLDGICVVNSPC